MPSKLSSVSLTLGLVPLVACGGWPKDLGDLPEDQVLLSDAAVLQHLADALEDSEGVDVATLIRDGGLEFTSAPDPSAWMQRIHDEHQALPELDDAVELRVLTWNVGLLDRSYLGTQVLVPDLEIRRAEQLELLFASDYDVLLLQELWEIEDAEAFADAAQAQGYSAWYGSDELHPQHGLFMAVRSEIIAETSAQGEEQYDAQRDLEYWPGPDMRRGWLSWSFELAGTGRTVHLYDTHTTAFPDLYDKRNLQARQLGLELSGHPDSDIVLLGGDLNSGPYYGNDEWIDGEGKAHGEWWRNAVAWALWQHYGGMVDAHGLAQPLEDVTLGDTVPVGGGESFLAEPFGDASWCDTTPVTTFTATDCNSLYFREYAATEAPARLDHLMLRDPDGAVRVDASGLVFTEAQDLDGTTVELSDHYGVEASMRIAL
jgi:hypothetical protein